ncbi:MAG: YdcF family protein [Firmicutes bacterium]|nr:YdcF family protein [Bacillota bacterium]
MKEIKALDPECIIVLGCAVKEDGTPSDMLRDRLDAGIALYNQGVAPKILLTGDNGQEEYNEIHAMLTYTLEEGVPLEDVFCDHAGFSTSESMIRADTIFSIRRAVVVTQRYHEYRAIYNAGKMGIDVLGVSASQSKFKGQAYNEIREILARNKDFLLFNVLTPTAVGGEKIDITGDGQISHGE